MYNNGIYQIVHDMSYYILYARNFLQETYLNRGWDNERKTFRATQNVWQL